VFQNNRDGRVSARLKKRKIKGNSSAGYTQKIKVLYGTKIRKIKLILGEFFKYNI